MRQVVFNEYNIQLGKACYLPFVSGLLRAYAETVPAIKENYQFAPFLYKTDALHKIMECYTGAPDVAAFSVYVWNEQLSLAVAAEVRKRWPSCLVVFGGAQVPHKPMDYFQAYPFIDVMVRGEGEEVFAAVLERALQSGNFDGIPQVAYRTTADQVIVNQQDIPFKKELDALPSPYLEGLYDDLMTMRGDDLEFQAIIESTRDCPFFCHFCFYGRTAHKLKYYETDRVLAEIDWVGRNKISYLFNADSNFGMQRRDWQIAEHLVATKKRYGYPEKFRTNFGKNADEKIYQIGLLLHEAQLEKGITLARQSNNSEVLKNIKRTNIKMSTYENLQVKFNDANVLVYSEFIMGLPGETLESWKRGLDETIAAGMKNQCLLYPCMILANTGMADPEYQRQHGCATRRIEMAEIHGSVRQEGWLSEYEDIVVATNTMPVEDWRKVVVFSYVFTLLHGLKVGYFLIVYLLEQCGIKPSELLDYIIKNSDPGTMWRRELDGYEKFLDGVLERGSPMAVTDPEYGNIYWEPDEISFMRFAEDWDRFYREVKKLVDGLISERGNRSEIDQVIQYQKMRMPTLRSREGDRARFDYNLHEYFTSAFGSNPVQMKEETNMTVVRQRDFGDDKQRFAREVVMFGRKNGTLLEEVSVQKI